MFSNSVIELQIPHLTFILISTELKNEIILNLCGGETVGG